MIFAPRRRVVAATCAAALLGLMPAARAATVTVDVYYANPSFQTFHEQIAQDFMKEHPDIQIRFRAPAPTYDVAQQTMLREAMTNQLPDINFASFNFLPELARTLARRNQILDLGPLLQQEGDAWVRANYTPNVLALAQVDGKQVGLPFNASLPIVYYNADLVRRAGGDPRHLPQDWPGIMDLAKKIRAAAPGAEGIGYSAQSWPDDWLWQALVQQAGGRMVAPDGKHVGFDGPVGLNGLKLLRSIVTEGGMSLLDMDQAREDFVAGKTGIYFDTPARLKLVSDLIGKRFTLKTAPYPVSDAAHGGLPTGGNAAVITARDQAKQKAAWEYINFETGPAAQAIVAKATGYMPLNLQSTGPNYLQPFYKANPNFATVSTELNRALPWESYPGGNSVQIWRTQRDIINSVMSGDTTPEAGLAQMVSQTNALMQ